MTPHEVELAGFGNGALGEEHAHSLENDHVVWTYLGVGKGAPGSIHSFLRMRCPEQSYTEPTPSAADEIKALSGPI